jgi:hypothetical protein
MKIGYTTLHSRGDEIVDAWAKGCNGLVRNITDYIKHGLPADCESTFFWGVLRGTSNLLKETQPYVHFDHAYFGGGHKPPFSYYRATYCALQNNKIVSRPDDRWNMFADKFNLVVKDWRKSGKHILVLPPTPAIMAVTDTELWLEETLQQLSFYTDRPIKVRHKPTEMGVLVKPEGIYPAGLVIQNETDKKTFKEDLENCWAVVTYNSMAAMEAVLYGVPAFVDATHCLAPLGNTNLENIDNPKYGKLQPILNHLSYCQWSLDEMASGEAISQLTGSTV